MIVDIPEIIEKMPINIVSRMKLERKYITLSKLARRKLHMNITNDSSYYPLVRNNRLYGNEELLRNYAKISEDLYALIEHGLYFGKNHQKVALKHEYELGCIITSGEYRKEIINQYFKDYYCETIGPMISYATTSEKMRIEIEGLIDKTRRTLLFFPVHGSDYYRMEYDIGRTLKNIISIADRYDCYNILICTFFSDRDQFEELVNKSGFTNRIKVVTCGNRYDVNFLPNQRAIIESSDITVSNSLGTHLGYCVYLQKPHILLPEDFIYVGNKKIIREEFDISNRGENWMSDFEKEKKMFFELFNEKTESITPEQYSTCDYYWGFSSIRSVEEIKEMYSKCHQYAKLFTKCKTL